MQRVLEKMAAKLNEYDEASLMQLWQYYASRVHEFEPTKRWEEAALTFCLIQAVHWKNQLFNYHLAISASPSDKDELPPLPDFFTGKSKSGPRPAEPAKRKATVLPFPDKHPEGSETGDAGENDTDDPSKPENPS